MDFSNLKSKALSARQSRSGIVPGFYQAKMVIIGFDLAQNGARMVSVEWAVISVRSVSEPISDITKMMGKRFKQRFMLEGKGADFGMSGLGEFLMDVAEPLGFDLEQYSSEEGLTELFTQLNSMTVTKNMQAKRGKNPQYLNWYFDKKNYSSVVGVPVQPIQNAGQQWGSVPPTQIPVQQIHPADVQTQPNPPPSSAASLFR